MSERKSIVIIPTFNEAENIVENVSEQEEVSFSQEAIATPETDQTSSNNLKEFGVEEDGQDLFSSENQNSTSDDLLGSTNDNQDDDLEIPAFLRRQKN